MRKKDAAPCSRRFVRASIANRHSIHAASGLVEDGRGGTFPVLRSATGNSRRWRKSRCGLELRKKEIGLTRPGRVVIYAARLRNGVGAL